MIGPGSDGGRAVSQDELGSFWRLPAADSLAPLCHSEAGRQGGREVGREGGMEREEWGGVWRQGGEGKGERAKLGYRGSEAMKAGGRE